MISSLHRGRRGKGHTIDSRHDEPYLSSIGRAGKMGIYLLRLVLIQGHESVQDIVACRSVIRSTFSNIRSVLLPKVVANLVQLAFIIREIILHGGHGELLLESVDLVQK